MEMKPTSKWNPPREKTKPEYHEGILLQIRALLRHCRSGLCSAAIIALVSHKLHWLWHCSYQRIPYLTNGAMQLISEGMADLMVGIVGR